VKSGWFRIAGRDLPAGSTEWMREMKKTFFASLTAAGALLASATAMANPIIEPGIESIDLDLGVNQVEIRVHNASNSNLLANLDLAVKTNQIAIPAHGMVKCSKGNNFNAAKIGFGVFNPTFYDSNVVTKADFPLTAYEWVGGDWLGEAMDPNYAYTIPVASLKNPAKENYQVDPLAEVAKMLEAHLDNGGSELSFYRNNHQVVLDRSVSVHAACWTGVSTNARATKHVPLSVKIVYEGDEDLANFKLNAVIQNSPQQGFQAGFSPFKVIEGDLIAYTPNYIGTCPRDLKFRASILVQGEGRIRYRITEGPDVHYMSEVIEIEKNEGDFGEDFVYELEWEGLESLQKADRHFRLQIAGKADDEGGNPTFFNQYASLDWSHTCMPKLNVGVGGMTPGGPMIQNGNQQAQQAQQAPKVGYQPSQPTPVKPERATSTGRETSPERNPARTTPDRQPTTPRTPAGALPDPQ